MLTNYIQSALRLAKYEILQDDGTFFAEIPECNGVYANADTLEECREQLKEVLEEWIFIRIYKNLSLPVINGIDLIFKEAA
ncbi:Type II toxin-antitoxin system HicB family antitoxin [Candidatus Magnetomoraceae bacterium gMMP-15]